MDHAHHPVIHALTEGDLEPTLPPAVREALLDLILAWANLDGSTAFLAAHLGGLDPSAGADRYGRKIIADKLKAAAKAAAMSGDSEFVHRISKASDEYSDYALLRKRVAHARCAGVVKTNPSRIVFLPYESEGDAQLVIEVYGLQEFTQATDWARALHEFIMAHVDGWGFFDTSA